jgi:hypothetical protein
VRFPAEAGTFLLFAVVVLVMGSNVSLCTGYLGIIPWGKSRSMKLFTYVCLVLRLRMREAVALLLRVYLRSGPNEAQGQLYLYHA